MSVVQIEYLGDVSIEDRIADESVVNYNFSYSYIKRKFYQNTKHKIEEELDKKSAGTRDQDFLEHLFVATNHQYLMFFTQKVSVIGCAKSYEIPEGIKTSKGRAIQNLINTS